MSTWAKLLGAAASAAAIVGNGSSFAEETIGVPVTVAARTTQTIDQIMERERLLPPFLLRAPRAIEQELEINIELKEDPNAPPPLSHWPPIPESFSGVLAPVEPPNLPQTVGTSFKAASYSEGGWFPPDSMGDVGPSQIVIHVNGRIKVFDKTGVLGALNADASTFWTPVSPEQFPRGPASSLRPAFGALVRALDRFRLGEQPAHDRGQLGSDHHGSREFHVLTRSRSARSSPRTLRSSATTPAWASTRTPSTSAATCSTQASPPISTRAPT